MKKTLPADQVIRLYHQLYKMEESFRIAKSDLETIPISHFKEEPIRLHWLICFISLVISKHVEIKPGITIKRFITECKKVTDARILNLITQKELIIKGRITRQAVEIIRNLGLPH